MKAGAATVRLRVHGRVEALSADALRQEIEDAVVGAAPEIEEIMIEGLGAAADAASLPALAG